MGLYVPNPVPVEAFKVNMRSESELAEVVEWCEGRIVEGKERRIYFRTEPGTRGFVEWAADGDWIVHAHGIWSKRSDEAFQSMYVSAQEDQATTWFPAVPAAI